MSMTIIQEGTHTEQNKNISEKMLYEFLKMGDKDFPEPLSNRVDLKEYAKKMHKNAVIIAEVCDDQIVGMFAGYINDESKKEAYISFVNILRKYRRNGIAKKLLLEFIDVARKKNFHEVHLHTSLKNQGAIKLYESNGFQRAAVVDGRIEFKYIIEENADGTVYNTNYKK